MEIIYCPWEPASLLFFSSNVPLLIHYSHFIAIFASMAIGILVFVNNPRSLLSRLFILFSALFSLWALLDVMLWATNDPGVVMFSWSLQVLLEPVTYAIAFLMFYIFLFKKIPSFKTNAFLVALLLPLVLFLPTTLNLQELYLSSCESSEGPLAKYYTYFVNFVCILMIVYIGVKRIPKLSSIDRRISLYFVIGLVTFLLTFSSGNILGSFTDDWTLSQYGLFGMPLFAALIAYSIVQYNAFKIEIAGAQVIVVILWALVGAQLFVEAELQKIISGLTLVFTSVAGLLLVRSVRQEFRQRQEIEKLAKNLEKANKRLKILDQMKSEFVSIASHQLRSPLTSIRGYASMLLEGSFGKLPDKAKEATEKIADSSRFMALSVEDYLNVSRIQSGNMKYELSDFNVKDVAFGLVDDMRREAMRHGLVLKAKSDLDSKGIVHADIGKTRQVIQNLIDNALKYTPKGTVTVSVRDTKRPKKIFIDVADSGIGMDPETIDTLFDKFERAHNANDVNVTGTGLGLYIARKMAEDMGGALTATSEGEGKGSVFTIELPLQM